MKATLTIEVPDDFKKGQCWRCRLSQVDFDYDCLSCKVDKWVMHDAYDSYDCDPYQADMINPMFFYWVSVADTAKFMLEILGTVGIAIAIFYFLKGSVDLDFAYGNSERDQAKKTRRMGIIMALISIGIVFGGIFIPSENTLIKIQVAKFGTYDNAEKVVQVIDKKTDALIDALANHSEESDEDE